MIHKLTLIFCENEHGTGDVCFPDVKLLDGHDIQQQAMRGLSLPDVRREAKAAGWGRINGGDYCPGCMEGM